MSSSTTTSEPLLAAACGGEATSKRNSTNKQGRRRVGIDEALTSYAGEFGRWQLRHFVLVSAAWALEALHTMVIIFADREPAMTCAAAPCGDRCAGAAAGWEWAGGAASSTVAEWGLVCGQRYKVGLAQAVFFAGCMIGQLRGLLILDLVVRWRLRACVLIGGRWFSSGRMDKIARREFWLTESP
jgi:MFS transporter, OCT family, solute carrier family 22 (organic cation transporter), member 4/5